MKRFIQLAISVLCLVFSAAAVYNVYADNTDVQGAAKLLACGEQPAGPDGRRPPGSESCAAQVTRTERTPFGQTFEFAIGKRTVTVRCDRAFLFLGDYACKLR